MIKICKVQRESGDLQELLFKAGTRENDGSYCVLSCPVDLEISNANSSSCAHACVEEKRVCDGRVDLRSDLELVGSNGAAAYAYYSLERWVSDEYFSIWKAHPQFGHV